MTFFSSNDAAILLTVFTAGVSLLVLWLKVLNWPDIVKFGVVILVCAIGGLLSALAANSLSPTQSLIANGAIIYTAGWGIYTVFFRALGLDKSIYPKAAVVKNASDTAQAQAINKISDTTAEQVLDTNHPNTLVVSTDVRQVLPPNPKPINPTIP